MILKFLLDIYNSIYCLRHKKGKATHYVSLLFPSVLPCYYLRHSSVWSRSIVSNSCSRLISSSSPSIGRSKYCSAAVSRPPMACSSLSTTWEREIFLYRKTGQTDKQWRITEPYIETYTYTYNSLKWYAEKFKYAYYWNKKYLIKFCYKAWSRGGIRDHSSENQKQHEHLYIICWLECYWCLTSYTLLFCWMRMLYCSLKSPYVIGAGSREVNRWAVASKAVILGLKRHW